MLGRDTCARRHWHTLNDDDADNDVRLLWRRPPDAFPAFGALLLTLALTLTSVTQVSAVCVHCKGFVDGCTGSSTCPLAKEITANGSVAMEDPKTSKVSQLSIRAAMGTWRLTAVRNIHVANSISPLSLPLLRKAGDRYRYIQYAPL